MIRIPQTKSKDKFYFWEAIFLFVLSIIFLAGLVVVGYWYVFGEKNPFSTKMKESAENQLGKPYVYPAYQLNNLMKAKLFNE